MLARAINSRRLPGGGFDAAILSVEQRYVALDKGMREMFFMGNEVKNSWGTLATPDKLIKENPKMVTGFVRATLKALRYVRQDKEGTISAMLKFSNVSPRRRPASTTTSLVPSPAMAPSMTKPKETISASFVRWSTPTKRCQMPEPMISALHWKPISS
jgi:hypothetical protein